MKSRAISRLLHRQTAYHNRRTIYLRRISLHPFFPQEARVPTLLLPPEAAKESARVAHAGTQKGGLHIMYHNSELITHVRGGRLRGLPLTGSALDLKGTACPGKCLVVDHDAIEGEAPRGSCRLAPRLITVGKPNVLRRFAFVREASRGRTYQGKKFPA